MLRLKSKMILNQSIWSILLLMGGHLGLIILSVSLAIMMRRNERLWWIHEWGGNRRIWWRWWCCRYLSIDIDIHSICMNIWNHTRVYIYSYLFSPPCGQWRTSSSIYLTAHVHDVEYTCTIHVHTMNVVNIFRDYLSTI